MFDVAFNLNVQSTALCLKVKLKLIYLQLRVSRNFIKTKLGIDDKLLMPVIVNQMIQKLKVLLKTHE